LDTSLQRALCVKGFGDSASLLVILHALPSGAAQDRRLWVELTSFDKGTTFEPLLRFDELCGQTRCETDTTVGQLCPADWQVAAPTIKATCGFDAGSSSAGQANNAAGQPRFEQPASPGAADGGCNMHAPPGAGVQAASGALLRARLTPGFS
jgi:hypothetical protein